MTPFCWSSIRMRCWDRLNLFITIFLSYTLPFSYIWLCHFSVLDLDSVSATSRNVLLYCLQYLDTPYKLLSYEIFFVKCIIRDFYFLFQYLMLCLVQCSSVLYFFLLWPSLLVFWRRCLNSGTYSNSLILQSAWKWNVAWKLCFILQFCQKGVGHLEICFSSCGKL